MREEYGSGKGGEIVGDEEENEEGDEGVERSVNDLVLDKVEAVGTAFVGRLSAGLQSFQLHL